MVPKYESELATILERVDGAQSASALPKMAAYLGVAAGGLTRWEQSMIEQQLCATAHAFLGSDRSTWTGNVALERDATLFNGRARNHFFGQVRGAAPDGRMVELRT